jgi:enterochelin esterase-like enzyme
MTSEIALGERFLIKVRLPESYFESDSTEYSVLYLTDADAFFGTAADCAYWLGLMKTQIIIIGVSYGSMEQFWQKRGRDFDPNPDKEGVVGAERFLGFMRDELFPKVEAEYRIDNSSRTLFGWSAGGGFVLYTLFNQPELFKSYLASGTPLIDHDRWAFRMERAYVQRRKDLPVRLYLGTGDYDPFGATSFPEFVQTLENRAYQGLQFKWEIIPDLRHEYKAVAYLLANGLDYLFGNLSIVMALRKVIDKQGVEAAIVEYNRLKKEHPDEYSISEGEIDWLGDGLLYSNRITEAIEIFKLNQVEHPHSWIVYNSLGKAYTKNAKIELAIENYSKSLELNPENTNAVEMLKELQAKQ